MKYDGWNFPLPNENPLKVDVVLITEYLWEEFCIE